MPFGIGLSAKQKIPQCVTTMVSNFQKQMYILVQSLSFFWQYLLLQLDFWFKTYVSFMMAIDLFFKSAFISTLLSGHFSQVVSPLVF
jgi:hypothetical protein